MSLRQRLISWSILTLFFVLAQVPLQAQIPIGGNISDGAGGPLLSGTVYHVSSNLSVPLGTTLTVQSGAILKFALAQSFTIDGTLDVTANVGPKAIFTALPDDTAGGDTDANGLTAGAPGFWRGITVNSTGLVHLDGLEIRFSGQSNQSALRLSTTPGSTVNNCIIRDYLGNGINYNTTGLATVTGSQFLNGTIPVVGIPLNAVSSFTNNTASGNSTNNSVNIIGGSVTGTVTVPANSMMGGAHILVGNLILSTGASLTVDAGVIFKLQTIATQITIDGTLSCNGTSGNPVVFTAFQDDDHGGDTNNDGLSSGAIGYWRGLSFIDNSDGSNLQYTVVRYTGQSSLSAIELMNADITMNECLIENCSAMGIDLNNGASLPVITNCHIDNVTIPIGNATWESLENFSSNTTANITQVNAVQVNQGTLFSNVSLIPSNLIGGVVVNTTNLTMTSSSSLSLAAGIVYKSASIATAITINGLLTCQGTGGNEVVFTVLTDDSYGGDTNVDGASSGSAGFWRGLKFTSTSDGSQLTHTRVRFSGQSSLAGITINDTDTQLTNCVIEDCSSIGISLDNTLATPTVTGCAIDRCSIAVDNIHLASVPGFNSNTAAGNTTRNSMQITGATLMSSTVISTTNVINNILEISGNIIVDTGVSLTLGQGIVVKMSQVATQIVVDGTLVCNGSAGQPVVFTVIADDQHGGDTSLNGASSGTPGFWRGIQFSLGSDASFLDHTIVRYSGQSSIAGIEIMGSNLTMVDCTISDCSAAGLDFNSAIATPNIRNCAFNNNVRSVQGGRWGNFTNFRDNTASGNTIYDSPSVDSGAVPTSVLVDARSMINGCFVVNAQPTISTGAVLTLGRGVVVKVTGVLVFFSGAGSLEVLGTAHEPVVLTVIADDDYAGDTNKNGPSTGTKGAWRGLNLANEVSSRAEYAVVRYAGQSSLPGVLVTNNLAALKSVRVEHGAADGFGITSISLAADLDNLVAFDCNGIGVDLNQTIQSLRFATVTGCGTGITAGVNFMGTIDGCVSYANTTNYSGATASNLFNSNGSAGLAGMNGNINADPLFIDSSTAVGDLRLQFTSPCIDAANFGLGMTVAADHFESSRLNDHDLDGNVGCDMGAFEFSNYSMAITGQPILGQTMTFTLLGLPGIGQICTALLDGTSYFSPFGMVLVGTPATVLLEDLVYEGYGYPIMVPNNAQFVGVEFGVQMGGAALGDTTTGNITNLYRGVVQD